MQSNLLKTIMENATKGLLRKVLFSHFCSKAYLVHPCCMVFHVTLVFEPVLTMVTRELFFGMHLRNMPLHVCCLVEMFFTVTTREGFFSSVSAHVQVQPPLY